MWNIILYKIIACTMLTNNILIHHLVLNDFFKQIKLHCLLGNIKRSFLSFSFTRHTISPNGVLVVWYRESVELKCYMQGPANSSMIWTSAKLLLLINKAEEW